jgi:AcrR family transcriptional regulator
LAVAPSGKNGYSKPIVYRHFESKKALYLALLTKHENDLPEFFEGLDDLDEPDKLARAILERWLDYVHENQHAWSMLFRDGSGDEEIQTVRRRVSLRAREVLPRSSRSDRGTASPRTRSTRRRSCS